jgi:amino acid adenylation domain-containing protein
MPAPGRAGSGRVVPSIDVTARALTDGVIERVPRPVVVRPRLSRLFEARSRLRASQAKAPVLRQTSSATEGERTMTDLAARATHSRSTALLDVFRHHVERDPDGIAFRFLDPGNGPGTALSRRELDTRARTVAAALHETGAAGGRALILLPAGLDFLTAFFGCLYAGVAAVPCAPPAPGERQAGFAAVGQDAGAAAVLTSAALAPGARDRWERAGAPRAAWIEVDRLPGEHAELWTPPPTSGGDLALLQYTSGSTGRPKGVAVTRDNLAAQLTNFRDLAELPAGGNVVTWMPVFHALGLGHLLLSQYVGGEGVFMTPDDFVAQPHRWLEAITATGGPVLGGGPNFAYQRCVDHVTPEQRERLDLGGWHAALVGGERIRPRTLESFVETFAPHGFRPKALFPAYGLTETMQIVAARRGPDPAGIAVDASALELGRARPAADGDRAQTLVGVGQAGPRAGVRIVDPDARTPCGDGEVGEVWIDGPVVCQGYWQRPEQTAETFGAHLHDGSGPFLRTGDLGFTQGGELVICGRLKELVIIHGRNLHPQDIEVTARDACPAGVAGPAAAFSAEVDDEERLVLVQAVDPAHDGLPALADRVRQAVTAEHETEPYEVVFVEAAAVPTTDSGKVRRGACRDAYLAGDLRPLATSRARAAAPAAAVPDEERPLREMVTALEPHLRGPVVTAEVRRRLAAALGPAAGEPPTDQPLAALGMESLRTIALRHGLERDFAVSLSTADFFRGTVTDIAAAITGLLDEGTRADSPWPTLVPDLARRHEPFPLTGLQHAYFVGRAATYQLGGTSIHLYAEHDSPDLDIDRLRAALDALVARQEMLRAVVSSDGHQRILPEVGPVPVREYDLRGAGEQAAADHLEALREELGHQVLPLDTWPMFDIRVTWLEGRHARVHVSLDLLIFDVASVRLFFMEWGDLYQDPNAELPALDVSFRDFVLAADKISATPAYQRSRAYWMERIETLPPAPELPLLPDPEPGVKPVRARRHDRLDAARWTRLKERAAGLGVTPTSVLLAAYATALGTWSRTSHFTIDVPLFSRFPLHDQIDRILGDFTSVSLLEVDLRPRDGMAGLAQRLQRQMWRDLEHRYFSGVEVMREAARARGIPPSAFASIVFASTREHGRDQSFEQGEWGSKWLGELVHGITQTPQVLLDHQVYERDGALTFNWDAVERLFPPGVLDDMFATYLRLLTELADDDGAWAPGGFTALPPRQRALVAAANDTAGPVPQGYLFSGIVEQARTHPDRTAVIAPGRTLTFGELHRHACRLGRRLRELGARPNQLVAVAMDKSAEQIAAVVAVQLAGAAYLPVDPELPPDRQDHLLRHGQAALVLTRAGGPDRDWPEGVTRVVVDLDEDTGAADTGQWAPLEPVQRPTDLAYVLYTSGSTGEPKGVMQTHRATLNTLADANELMGAGPGDRALGLSALSFDLSVWDVFGALGAGAALVLPEPGALRDPARWLELMAEHRVTLWNSVPALMQMLVEHAAGGGPHPGLDALRIVWFSGDWIPVDLPGRLRALAPSVRVVASGGPTETAIWCVANPLGEVDPAWDSIPYGRPMRNHTIHVLDDRLEPCPLWCPGEMYIGGEGLAQGYWRDPERTARSFVTHPVTGERLYRSGDLGRWLPTGELEILGRRDLQVKIGGFRIELGEIESALVRHDAVRAAAVVAAGPDRHRRTLAAFVVPAAGHDGDGPPADGHDVMSEELGDVVTDPVERLAHKVRQPGRRTDLDGEATALPVSRTEEEDDALDQRRASHRHWAAHPVPLAGLARLLENLRGRGSGPLPKYRYASAGSLYPVQTYLYAAPGRVEGLEGGTYYYDPIGHRLVAVRPGTRLDRDIHVPDNHALFERSAFTVFLVAQRHAIEPLYGKRTRDFCLLEAGLMAQVLDGAAADCDLGLCQVGLIRQTAHLREALALDDGHTVLHGIVGGARRTGTQTPGTSGAPATGATLAEELRSHLAATLPKYMVPATVTTVDRIPLTPRGKVDRQALERLALQERGSGGPGTGGAGYVAPRDETERTITTVVQSVLGRDRIGVLDNFFDLGTDSVVVVKIHRRLREVLERDFSLMTMFERPNIRRLAEFLAGDEGPADTGTRSSADAGFERAQRRATRRRRGRRGEA